MKSLILYDDGQTVTKSSERIEVVKKGMVALSEPVIGISDILILGNIQITAQALKFLAKHSIDITHATKSGKIYAYTDTMSADRCAMRIIQYNQFSNDSFKLEMAKLFCRLKINTQAEYLLDERRKLGRKSAEIFKGFVHQLDNCRSINEVLGVEGRAANFYFAALSKVSAFEHRSRRPARDVFNALLNLTYTMLLYKINSILHSKSLDTQVGFLHCIKSGRPSLSLDVLELFRTKADKFVVKLTNRKEFKHSDFTIDEETNGYFLNKKAFSRYIEKYSDAFNIESEVEVFCGRLIIALKSGEVSVFEQA